MAEDTVASGSVKPGYKTTEFWLSLAAMVVSALMASGVIASSSMWGQVVGVVSGVLTSLGYTVSRSLVKSS